MAARMLWSISRPLRMASVMLVKLSSSSTMSAASRATSVPRSPIAMPTSAAFSAGASLTPSPVMPTRSPAACSAWTRSSFCSGAMRAQMRVVAARVRSSCSLRPFISAPVSTAPTCSRPTCSAMALAVAGWSPVIMMTRTPARRHCAIASATSGRGGSMKPTRPRKLNSNSCWLAGKSPPVHSPRATPNTRMPRLAMASTSVRSASSWGAVKWQRSATASGAPLVASNCRGGLPCANTCVIARMSGDSSYCCCGTQSPCTCEVPARCRVAKARMAFSIGSNGSAGVASSANSTSSWKASGSSAVPVSR